MELYKGYELVVGLEVHAELATDSKIFCSCSTSSMAEPNSQVCPVCLGLPGAMPSLNRKAVEYAIKAGLATGCSIAPVVKMDRKNYFYPDLPKAYQISQFDIPLCENGKVMITTDEGEKSIGITRIHIEEDAGKLNHRGGGSYIDNNRCGVPLIEIVSEPDLRSAAEVTAYLKELRSILVYAGVSKCRMNMGELRCDINLSVRRPGETLGVRTEMKNLNSFAFAEKAVEYEYHRQVDVLEKGGEIVQETRRFDQDKGITLSMRRKENAGDYRFFPEPDIPVTVVSDDWVNSIRESLPKLPSERRRYYVNELGLSSYVSTTITEDKAVSDYFDEALKDCCCPVSLANLLMGDVFAMSEGGEIAIKPRSLGRLANLLGESEINSATAKKLLKALWGTDTDPVEYVDAHQMRILKDREIISQLCRNAVEKNAKSAEDYKKGKSNALKALVGAVMAASKGRADPEIVNEILLNMLK